jgi:DUF971 family protein
MPAVLPAKLDLKRDEKLEILWKDGRRSVYLLSYLRSMCPCAVCKMIRENRDPHELLAPMPEAGKKVSLSILPGNYSQPLSVLKAELVGNYAIKIDWSDEHATGIYSFEYLREIAPAGKFEIRNSNDESNSKSE